MLKNAALAGILPPARIDCRRRLWPAVKKRRTASCRLLLLLLGALFSGTDRPSSSVLQPGRPSQAAHSASFARPRIRIDKGSLGLFYVPRKMTTDERSVYSPPSLEQI